MKSQIYARDRVPNTARKFGAAQDYYPVVAHLPHATNWRRVTDRAIVS